MAIPRRINHLLLTVAGLAIVSSAGLIQVSLATTTGHQLQDSVKSLVHDSFRALDKELTRLTGSNELEANRAAARGILEHSHKSNLERLAKALIALRGDEDRNSEQLCSAENLANLRILVSAMAKSSKHPTREPESRRRLNLLLVKQTNSVRSYCYEQLSKSWHAQVTSSDTPIIDDPHLAPLDNVSFNYLFRDELKRHKQQNSPSNKHKDLVPLVEHLRHQQLEPKQSGEMQQHEVLLEFLVKPCQRLTKSHLTRDILQPRVDLTTIELIVYHQVDMAHRDYKSYFINQLNRFIMCQKLLAPTSTPREHLLSELRNRDINSGESRMKRHEQRRMSQRVFSSPRESQVF